MRRYSASRRASSSAASSGSSSASSACLVREEPAGLQLEQRGDEHEELAARLEVELAPLGEPLAERERRSRRRRPRPGSAPRAGRASGAGRRGPRRRRGRARARATSTARDASGGAGRGPWGSAIVGPCGLSGAAAALPRRLGSPPRRNCHQTKNAVGRAKTTIETQTFSRSPTKWCDGSTRSNSSKMRPNV